jgi:hypothetical protein
MGLSLYERDPGRSDTSSRKPTGSYWKDVAQSCTSPSWLGSFEVATYRVSQAILRRMTDHNIDQTLKRMLWKKQRPWYTVLGLSQQPLKEQAPCTGKVVFTTTTSKNSKKIADTVQEI